MVVAQIGALGGWSKPLPTSHLLVRLSVWGRPKQRARTILRGCYFEASLSQSGCRNLSERAFFVPRLALIGNLRQSYGRERIRSGDLRNLVTYSLSQAECCRAQGNTTSERQSSAEEVLEVRKMEARRVL